MKRITYILSLFILISLPLLSFTPTAVHTVTGTVTYRPPLATFPTPIAGVMVEVPGTSLGTLTDEDGRYSLTIPNGSMILKFSGVGLATEHIYVDDRNIIDVQMFDIFEAEKNPENSL